MKQVKRRVKKIKKKRIIVIMIVLMILSIYLLQRRNNTTFAEKAIKNIFLAPLNIIIKSFNLNGRSQNTIIDNSELKALELKNDELAKENNELKELINVNNMLGDSVTVTANIINRNIEYFFDIVTINKGSSSGIVDGMAVVTTNGLIGKTTNVSLYYSDVQLLTSKYAGKLSVKIKNNNDYVYGILINYDEKRNVYYVEGISETVNVDLNSDVTTTGMSDIFPSGILVGRVTNITTDHFDLAKIIEVTPSVNINDFTLVTVLKRNVNS